MEEKADCSSRLGWGDIVDQEEELSTESQEQNYPQKTDGFYQQFKELREKELTRVSLGTQEYRNHLQKLLDQVQEADDWVRLHVKLLRGDLDCSSKAERKIINWEVLEKETVNKLIDVAESQLAVKRCMDFYMQADILQNCFHQGLQTEPNQFPNKSEDLMDVRRQEQLTSSSKAKRIPIRCFHCQEEGHKLRKCPHRQNRARWMLTPAFQQKLVKISVRRSPQHVIASTMWLGNESDRGSGASSTVASSAGPSHIYQNPLV